MLAWRSQVVCGSPGVKLADASVLFVVSGVVVLAFSWLNLIQAVLSLRG